MILELPNGRKLVPRLLAVAICGVASVALSAAQADEAGHHTTVANSARCPTCFRAEAKVTPVAAPAREDPLGTTLCGSAMSSSPPLAPLCGRYR
jgi:hypothetical protein